jgi:hypothetical protein
MATAMKEIGRGLRLSGISEQGRDYVRQCVNYRQERACAMLNDLAYTAAQKRDENAVALVSGMLEEFANQLKAAEDWDFQHETNQLLWYFKVKLSEHLPDDVE